MIRPQSRLRSAIQATSWELAGVAIASSVLLSYALGKPVLALPIACLAILLGILAVAVRPIAAVACATFLFGVAAQPLNELAIDIGVKIYAADVLVGSLLLGLLLRSLASPSLEEKPWPATWRVSLLIAALLFSAAHGLAAHNDMRAVLGDFRRMVLYPSVLFVVFYAIRDADDISTLLSGVVVAGLGIAAIAGFRIATGIGVLQGGEGEMTVRYLSFLEASTAGVAILIVVGRARIAAAGEAWPQLLLAVPMIAAVIYSNYRTAWAALALGLGAQAFALGWRRAVRALLVGTLLLLPVIGLLLTVTSLRQAVLARFDTLDVFRSGAWRLFSWLKAYQVWRSHPIFGTGMGYVHEFSWFKFNTQEVVAESGRAIHNDALWFLVNNGLVGAAAAIPFAFAWFRRAGKLASSLAPEPRFIGSTAIGSIVLLVSNSMLQPFFSFAAESLIAALFLSVVLHVYWIEREKMEIQT